jgi:hypothetical protein
MAVFMALSAAERQARRRDKVRDINGIARAKAAFADRVAAAFKAGAMQALAAGLVDKDAIIVATTQVVADGLDEHLQDPAERKPVRRAR